MTRHEAIQEQIETIMDEFDFGAVHKIFQDNGWEYHDSDGVPSIGRLRKSAREQLRFVSRNAIDGIRHSGSGRFTVIMTENPQEGWLRLELLFTPESWSNEPTDYDTAI